MKKVFLPFLLLAAIAFTACENGPKDGTEAKVTNAKAVAQNNANGTVYVIDTNAGNFKWEGHKIGKSHHGDIHLQSGQVFISDNKITGGNFVMDMNSINDIDLKGKDDAMQSKLITHLKSDEFFDVAKYPTANFEITSVKDSSAGDNNTWVEGNLTIKGKTQNIGFPAKIDVDENKATAKAKVIIDRSKFDVRYGSKNFFADLAGDKIISNDITLDIDFVANKQ
ncbi:MAG: YceI family protein [Sphingobacteriales bacterium]|nr:MAG: YceI family protein [Sphingobacteriales bacterium]